MQGAQHRFYSALIFLGLLAIGLTLLAFPTVTQSNGQEYFAQVTTTELDASVGYAPPGYSADAHVTSQNQVTVTLTLVGSSTVLFSQVFPAGTFDMPAVTIVNGGNLFLKIQPQNGVFTQMTVFARIFQSLVTYQYSWVGILVLGATSLFALASFFPQTLLGRAAGRIIPVHKMRLA